jgi:hypothetical protein
MRDKFYKVIKWIMIISMAVGFATLLYWGYYFLLTGWKLLFTTK